MDAVNEGADAYFMNPFNPVDLIVKIRKLLPESM
jgi:DNA-binding response OmpR family regulator